MKSKRKTSQRNPIRYWLDELIFFRRDFMIETSTPMDKCAETIRKMETIALPGFFRPLIVKSQVKRISQSPKIYQFRLQLAQVDGRDLHRSAGITGKIYKKDGIIFVEGASRLIGLSYWFFIFTFGSFLIWLLSGNPISVDAIPIAILILGSPMLYLWGLMYRDRNKVLTLLIKSLAQTEKEFLESSSYDSDISPVSTYDAHELKHKANSR